LVKWILKKKLRIKTALVVVVAISLAYLVQLVFFSKMEFIQSKVYPDLYLVKNPHSNTDSIHSAIKKMVFEKVNKEFLNNKGVYEFSKNTAVASTYRLRFYEYYTGTFFLIPFGEAGTTHFIEYKEDPGGFSSEEIIHYQDYRIAEFNLKLCENDNLNYVGTIDFYENREVVKRETIINQCEIIIYEAATEAPAEAVTDYN
jgi:hypothetical protein